MANLILFPATYAGGPVTVTPDLMTAGNLSVLDPTIKYATTHIVPSTMDVQLGVLAPTIKTGFTFLFQNSTDEQVQQNIGATNYGCTNKYLVQTFTAPTTSGIIKRIQITAGTGGLSADDYDLYFFSTSAGAPNAVIVGPFHGKTISGAGTGYWDVHIPYTGSVVYGFGLVAKTGKTLNVYSDDGNQYAGGKVYYGDTLGSLTPITAKDLVFVINCAYTPDYLGPLPVNLNVWDEISVKQSYGFADPSTHDVALAVLAPTIKCGNTSVIPLLSVGALATYAPTIKLGYNHQDSVHDLGIGYLSATTITHVKVTPSLLGIGALAALDPTIVAAGGVGVSVALLTVGQLAVLAPTVIAAAIVKPLDVAATSHIAYSAGTSSRLVNTEGHHVIQTFYSPGNGTLTRIRLHAPVSTPMNADTYEVFIYDVTAGTPSGIIAGPFPGKGVTGGGYVDWAINVPCFSLAYYGVGVRCKKTGNDVALEVNNANPYGSGKIWYGALGSLTDVAGEDANFDVDWNANGAPGPLPMFLSELKPDPKASALASISLLSVGQLGLLAPTEVEGQAKIPVALLNVGIGILTPTVTTQVNVSVSLLSVGALAVQTPTVKFGIAVSVSLLSVGALAVLTPTIGLGITVQPSLMNMTMGIEAPTIPGLGDALVEADLIELHLAFLGLFAYAGDRVEPLQRDTTIDRVAPFARSVGTNIEPARSD